MDIIILISHMTRQYSKWGFLKKNAFLRKITKVGPHIGMEDGKNTQHSQSAGRFPRFFPHLRAKQSSSSSTNLTNCARQNQHFKSAMIFLSRESILGRTNLDCLHTEQATHLVLYSNLLTLQNNALSQRHAAKFSSQSAVFSLSLSITPPIFQYIDLSLFFNRMHS